MNLREGTLIQFLAAIEKFEESADAGYGREVAQAYLSALFADGSGRLKVEYSCTQNDTPEQTMFSRIFTSSREFKFDSLEDLQTLLTTPHLLVIRHPEIP